MKIKTGNTFGIYLNFVDGDGDPVAHEEVECQVRLPNGRLIDTLVVTATSTVGRYLAQSADTSKYPETTLYSDVKVTDNGKSVSSDTFTIEVERGVTE